MDEEEEGPELHRDCRLAHVRLQAQYEERQRTVEWWVRRHDLMQEALLDIISLLVPAPDSPRVIAARQRATDALHPPIQVTAVVDRGPGKSIFGPLTPAFAAALLAKTEQRMNEASDDV
jgi:hypothetical protein